MHVPVFMKTSAALSLLLALAACGGGGGSDGNDQAAADPLADYVAQDLGWSACDPGMLPGKLQPDLEMLGARAQCAFMRAPMDYDKPGQVDVRVALLRVSAADPDRRKGAILLNPGGPGDDGIPLAPMMASLFQLGAPGTSLGDAFRTLNSEYDLVGFSPRGTGASTRQYCASTEPLRQVDYSRDGVNAQNIANIQYNNRLQAEACARNPLTPHINTDATARDMDLLRSILGDQTLNYIGYSYGTWLGGWYARRFPDRVNRIVLDGAVDLTQPLDNIRLLQTSARQRILDDYVAPYVASQPDKFNLGTSTAGVQSVLPGLSIPVMRALYAPLSGMVYKRAQIDDLGTTLAGAHGLDAVLAQYPDADADDIRQALSNHVFVPGNAVFDAEARDAAQGIFSIMTTPFASRPLEDASSFWSIVCNDSPQRGQQFWIDQALQENQRYVISGLGYMQNLCGFWQGPRATLPAWEHIAQRDVLMVQSEFDGATPVAGARAGFDALPNASLVYVPDEYSHGLFATGNDCVNEAVARYLIGEAPGGRETTCAPNPPRQGGSGPARASAPQADAAADAQSPTTPANPNYTDAERARQLQERIRDSIGVPGR